METPHSEPSKHLIKKILHSKWLSPSRVTLQYILLSDCISPFDLDTLQSIFWAEFWNNFYQAVNSLSREGFCKKRVLHFAGHERRYMVLLNSGGGQFHSRGPANPPLTSVGARSGPECGIRKKDMNKFLVGVSWAHFILNIWTVSGHKV